MKITEIEEAKKIQRQQHKLHISKEDNLSCIYCNPITKTKYSFNKFWDWIQINYSALLVTRKTAEAFEELCKKQEEKEAFEIQLDFKRLIDSITFEKEITEEEKIQIFRKIREKNYFQTRSYKQKTEERLCKALSEQVLVLESEEESTEEEEI